VLRLSVVYFDGALDRGPIPPSATLPMPSSNASRVVRLALGPALLALLAGARTAHDVIGNFPVIEVPLGNPLTPEKALLGQALFFEEQLSSDDSMACATCHLPDAGGSDPRSGARSPGADSLLNTLDDEFGSPGLRLQDAEGDYQNSAAFGIGIQNTGRNSPPAINAVFFNTQFWDSRALPTFRNTSGGIVLLEFASLESQAVEPILSPVEMGHVGRTWTEVTTKLAAVRPLDLAFDLPPALEAFVGNATSYGPLFQQAFGSSTITRERIAFAIASYERTLVADQTPFDLGTLTARQLQGFSVYQNKAECEVCHPSDNKLFTDGAMRTIELPNHDRFSKTPSLRNVGLHERFMSSGQFTDLNQVLNHYQTIDILDPITPDERVALLDFLIVGLTDPRLAARTGPFDRPTLASERRPSGANLYGKGTLGTGGVEPQLLADAPLFAGDGRFQLGLGHARPGARAVLLLSNAVAPSGTEVRGVALAVDPARATRIARVTATGGSEDGLVTFKTSVPPDPALLGLQVFAQWLVLDPGAATGLAATRGAWFEVLSRTL